MTQSQLPSSGLTVQNAVQPAQCPHVGLWALPRPKASAYDAVEDPDRRRRAWCARSATVKKANAAARRRRTPSMADLLIIDDTPETCDLLARMFARHGHAASCLHDGGAAVAA